LSSLTGSHRQGGRRLPHPRRCRPQGSCPSRRFRRPNASRPCFMPLAYLELPSRAFPSRGAVPSLLGLFSLAGSSSDRCRCVVNRGFATAFPGQGFHPGSRRLFAPSPPVKATRDAGAVTKVPRDCYVGRVRPACAGHLDRHIPSTPWLTGERPARPLRSFAPPGSPFSSRPRSLSGEAAPAGALLGFAFPL
jgi:hypothetical protein